MLRVSPATVLDDRISDAELALHLFVRNPHQFGGIILKGPGPVREAMVAFAQEALAKRGPVARIPVNIDSERLLGGLDLSATLAAGRGVMRSGLLNDCSGGVVILPMAERIPRDIAAHIAQAMDGRKLAAILLDDSVDGDEAPPPVLTERIAFHCDMSELRQFDGAASPTALHSAALTDMQLVGLVNTASALGIGSARAYIFAHKAAHAHAEFHGRAAANDDDLTAAVRLVLAPRATQFPPDAPPEPESDPPPDQPDSDPGDDEERQVEDMDLEDILLVAAAAAIPKHILDQIDGTAKGKGKGHVGRSGQKQKSAQRGRSLGARPGVPGHGRKLALIDSLRAAAPWQSMRRAAAAANDHRRIHIRKSDLRVRHYEQRRESLTIFAVDASGSSALSRLAEAKGAVEMMLAQAYVKRSQVALIAFRQNGAEILLPPTRSLTRARRALAALPGGGGTPLAAGLQAAQHMAETAMRGGQTPTIAILTDGKANVRADGTANRELAMAEAKQAAKSLAQSGVQCIVIDISPRPRVEAAELAEALNGRYLPLPQAQSTAMVAAIESIGG
jgi:magnesium chelatase subunit D